METPWGAFTYLFVVWAAVTTGLLALVIYRGILSQHEDDQLFLDAAEDRIASEQRQLVMRLDRLSMPIRTLGVASGVLLLVMIGLKLWEAFRNF